MNVCSLQFGVRSMLEQSVPKRLPWRHTAANNRKQQEAKSSPGGLLVPVPVLVLVLVWVWFWFQFRFWFWFRLWFWVLF